MTKSSLQKLLQIEHPVIMAPMFLVSNVAMSKEGMKQGIAVCIPALNYRTLDELRDACKELKASKTNNGAFGFNLIVNKSNPKFKAQLEVICEEGADFIITSLGSPKSTIEAAHKVGIKVFCDVVDLAMSKKVESLGGDAIIAVNNQAGGHRGDMNPLDLIKVINDNCSLPVISAGGVGCKSDIDEMISYGAIGVSVGSPFIASEEAGVSKEYKQACVDYGADDIIMTERISGTPCTVIKTPYVEKIGTKNSWLESVLNKNKKLKKWVKMIRFTVGMKAVANAANKATYKTVWVAGPSIEYTNAILPVKGIIDKLIK
jgi:nitronate monooxygenase